MFTTYARRTGAGLALAMTAAAFSAPVSADPVVYKTKDNPAVPNPMVEGPITGGIRGGAYNRSRFPLTNGFVEQEFFFAGQGVGPGGQVLPYRTRILVRRPSDPARFNGTVVLDWTNVTVPDDTDVNWGPMHKTVMERGFVYVAVAAQRLGVEGASPLALKNYDPVRYGTLFHPSDDLAYDIFAQASEAVLNPAVLGDLAPLVERRYAVGASQSGGKLRTYINSHAETKNVFDGYLPEISGPDGTRHDLVPVLWLNSQSEHDDVEPEADSGNFVLWEMPGSAHAPFTYSEWQNSGYVFHETNGLVNIYDEEAASAWGYQLDLGECSVPNTFDAGHLYSAALVALDNWVKHGDQPRGWRIDRTGGVMNYDEYENIKGGMPSPLMEAPIAHYYAGAVVGSTPCGAAGVAPLIGSTQAFSADDLKKRYASTDQYSEEFRASVDRAIAAGTLLPENAEDLLRRLALAEAWVAQVLGPKTEGKSTTGGDAPKSSPTFVTGGLGGSLLVGLLGGVLVRVRRRSYKRLTR